MSNFMHSYLYPSLEVDNTLFKSIHFCNFSSLKQMFINLTLSRILHNVISSCDNYLNVLPNINHLTIYFENKRVN